MSEELDYYGTDTQIASGHGKVPLWLKVTYIIFPIWGIVWLMLYWNGVHGWLDRGYWFELEDAAGTTVQSWQADR